MLLCGPRFLYAHCTTELCWLTRRAAFGPANLIDIELTVDFAEETTPEDIVTVVATRPLTSDEPWYAMEPGETIVFRDGVPVKS